MAMLDHFRKGLAGFCIILAILFAVAVQAQSSSPAPAPGPSSDGNSVDLGIAYILMMVALVLAYLIHPLEASSYNF